MKKLLSVILVFLFLFSACKKQPLSEETTTKPYPESSTGKTLGDLTTHYSDITETVTKSTQSTTKKKPTVDITGNSSNSHKENVQNSSPAIIFATFPDLVRIKSLLNTVQPENFAEYIRENELDFAMNGMDDYESTIKLMNELENTYIPLLDNDKANFSTISFYWERNEVQQITFFDEESRVVCYIYTPESGRDSEGRFGENENAVFIKSIENNLAKAEVYKIGDKEYFCVDVLVEDTYIFMRTHKIISIEEFETNFNRLEFVKIGDLLN